MKAREGFVGAEVGKGGVDEGPHDARVLSIPGEAEGAGNNALRGNGVVTVVVPAARFQVRPRL